MYNKYSSMKKSELKEAIKNEITSVLSEEIQVGDIVTLGGDGDELEVIDSREMFGSDMMAHRVKFPNGDTAEYSADQLRPARMMNEGTWSLGKASDINIILSQLQDLSKKAYNIIGDDEFYNGIDAAITRAEELMMNAPLNEDDEPTAADLKKKDSVASISNKLQKLTAKMKKKAKEFKEAEGKAKDKLKDELKDMTAEKKKLEKGL